MSVSVVLPNYNHGHYLSDALDAIFSQSLKPMEVIVIDDGSTDNSLDIISAYQKRFPEIRLIQNAQNLGPVKTINKGFVEAKGDFVTACAADDIILEGFFEQAANFLANHPKIGLCCGEICHFQDHKPYHFALESQNVVAKAEAFSPERLKKLLRKTRFFIHSTTSLYRRKYVLQYGGLSEDLMSISDWYLNYQIALNHGVGFIPKPFGAFRLTSGSYSQKLKRSGEKRASYSALMKDIKRGGKEWEHLFLKTGLLGQVGIRMVLFLLSQRKHWNYFPRAFAKKCAFHWNKSVIPKTRIKKTN